MTRKRLKCTDTKTDIMSLTKENFDGEFRDRTIADCEYHQEQESREIPFQKLSNCIIHCNKLRGVNLTGNIVEKFNPTHSERAIIKGKYSGLVFSEQNHTYRTIICLIESYGFIILKEFFMEEEDEGFTNLSFTIKNQ